MMSSNSIAQKLSSNDGIEESFPYKVKAVSTKPGAHLYKGKKICELINEGENKTVTVKAKFAGVVSKLAIRPGDKVSSGDVIIEVNACTHPTVLGSICCDCGEVLEPSSDKAKEETSQGHVSMLHSIPDLKVSKEEATRLGNEDIKHLLDKRKLVLLVDLDQTLIHTTNDNIPPKLKDVFHFQLVPNGPWYHTRLRPYTCEFLNNISKLFELHICTFGVRAYAHAIAKFLDPDRKLFADRILSRNECLDQMSKKANLSSLFPCGDNLVCIIDDRSDVWNFAPNVVQVLPYHFFQHTGDINAPPGLQKNENDDSEMGFDFSNLEDLASTKKEEYNEGQTNIESYENEEKEHRELKEVEKKQEDEKSHADDENMEEGEKDHGKKEGKNSNEKDEIETESIKKCPGEDIKNEKNINKSELNKITESESIGDEIQTGIEDNYSNKIIDKTTVSNENNESELNIDKEQIEKEQDKKVECKIDSEIDKNIEDNCESKELVEKKLKLRNENRYSSESMDSDDETALDKDVLDVADSDDYLLYLEDILKKLHNSFYALYDSNESTKSSSLPDLKQIVPDMKKRVLSNKNLVFSGIVPQNTSLRESKAYHIATSLGAKVNDKLIMKSRKENSANGLNYTTHVIAANLHTEKVHLAKRLKYIKIVTPNWLWCCAERWELVDERLFALDKNSENSVVRNPPLHCLVSLNDCKEEQRLVDTSAPTKEDLFQSLNPLAYFSNDETKSMEDEVDDLLSGEEDNAQPKNNGTDSEGSSDSYEADSALESSLKGSNDEYEDTDDKSRRRKRRREADDDDDDLGEEEEEDELPSIRFRQGGSLPSDESDVDSGDDEMSAYGDILARQLMRD